jgi:hypothetical protein
MSWKLGVNSKFPFTRNRDAHWTLLGCWVFYILAFHLLANVDLDRAIFRTVQVIAAYVTIHSVVRWSSVVKPIGFLRP